MTIYTNLDLNDSEILRLDAGPLAWAKARQGSSMNVDAFVKALEEQINQCGFTCEAKVFDTDQRGTYAFEIEINGRTAGSVFDPDRQVHEVVNNLLQLPGEKEGFIPTKDAAARLLNHDFGGSKHKH